MKYSSCCISFSSFEQVQDQLSKSASLTTVISPVFTEVSVSHTHRFQAVAEKKKKKTASAEHGFRFVPTFSCAAEAAAQGALRAASGHRGARTQHPIGRGRLSRYHRQDGDAHYRQVPEVCGHLFITIIYVKLK